MSSRNKNGLAVLLRAFLLLACWGSVVSPITLNGWDELEWLMLSFPYHCNLFIMVLTVIYLGLGFRTRITGGTGVPRALQITRYVLAVASAVTFVYYWVAVLPGMSALERSLLTPLLQFIVVPLLFLTDFFFFDRGKPVHGKHAAWALAFPLWFSLYSFARAALYPYHYYNHSHFGYAFLDADVYGLIGNGNGLGVLWRLLIVYAIFLAAGFCLGWIQRKTIRPKQDVSPDA